MTTAMTMARRSIRQLAAALAVVITMASLPSIGVIVVADNSGPSISLDICHPLQSMDRTSGTILVARPAPPEVVVTNAPPEKLAASARIFKSKIVIAPDSPPPKALA
jgi:hypothetical protein